MMCNTVSILFFTFAFAVFSCCGGDDKAFSDNSALDSDIAVLSRSLIPRPLVQRDENRILQMGALSLLVSSLNNDLLNNDDKIILLQYAFERCETAHSEVPRWQKEHLVGELLTFYPNAIEDQKISVLRLLGYIRDARFNRLIEESLQSENGRIVAAALFSTASNESKNIRMTLAQVCYRLSGALQIIALNRLYDMDKRLNINGGDDYKLLVQRFPHLADTYESIVAREKRTMQREEQAKTTAADLKARIKETEVGSALNFKLYGDD